MAKEKIYRTKEVCELAQVSPSQLERWIAAGYVVPSCSGRLGNGKARLFEAHDVWMASVISELKRVVHPALFERLASLVSVWTDSNNTIPIYIEFGTREEPDNFAVGNELPESGPYLVVCGTKVL